LLQQRDAQPAPDFLQIIVDSTRIYRLFEQRNGFRIRRS